MKFLPLTASSSPPAIIQPANPRPLPQALENRTLDSKREMDIMTALDELQSLNARHSHVTPDQALAAIKRSGGVPDDEALAIEDEELIRQMMFQGRSRRLDDTGDSSDDSGAGAGRRPAAPAADKAATANGNTGEGAILALFFFPL